MQLELSGILVQKLRKMISLVNTCRRLRRLKRKWIKKIINLNTLKKRLKMKEEKWKKRKKNFNLTLLKMRFLWMLLNKLSLSNKNKLNLLLSLDNLKLPLNLLKLVLSKKQSRFLIITFSSNFSLQTKKKLIDWLRTTSYKFSKTQIYLQSYSSWSLTRDMN